MQNRALTNFKQVYTKNSAKIRRPAIPIPKRPIPALISPHDLIVEALKREFCVAWITELRVMSITQVYRWEPREYVLVRVSQPSRTCTICLAKLA